MSIVAIGQKFLNKTPNQDRPTTISGIKHFNIENNPFNQNGYHHDYNPNYTDQHSR